MERLIGRSREGLNFFVFLVWEEWRDDFLAGSPVKKEGQLVAFSVSLSQQVFTPTSDSQIFIDKQNNRVLVKTFIWWPGHHPSSRILTMGLRWGIRGRDRWQLKCQKVEVRPPSQQKNNSSNRNFPHGSGDWEVPDQDVFGSVSGKSLTPGYPWPPSCYFLSEPFLGAWV